MKNNYKEIFEQMSVAGSLAAKTLDEVTSYVKPGITTKELDKTSTTILSEKGIVGEKTLVLFNGQIISTEKNNFRNSIIKFEQLNIDLNNLKTDTIKQPKLQETSTLNLLKCIFLPKSSTNIIINCNEKSKMEIITVLNRRIILPFYIPIISLLCSFLLVKNKARKKNIFNKYIIFALSFLVLLYAELIIRFTGISKIIGIIFVVSPFILIPAIYLSLIFKFSNESVLK